LHFHFDVDSHIIVDYYVLDFNILCDILDLNLNQHYCSKQNKLKPLIT